MSRMAVIPAPERLRQEDYKFGVSVNFILRSRLPNPKETKILTVHFRYDSKAQTAKEGTEVGLYQTKKLDIVKPKTRKGTCEKGETVKEVPNQRGLASKSQGTLISRCHKLFSSHRLHVQQGSRVFVSLRRTE